MEFLGLSILFSSIAWILGLLVSTFVRASGGVDPILKIVYAQPPLRVLLIAGFIALVLAILVFANTRRYLLTIVTIPPLFLGAALMLYQCLDMEGWYLSHFPFFNIKGGEPFNLFIFSFLYLLKAALLSGIALFPALYSLDYGVRGRKGGRRHRVFPTDAALISLGVCAVLVLLALLSTKTGFGVHYFPKGYLDHLF